MKVKRTIEIDAAAFEVGDILSFALTDGEPVEAMAVKVEPSGTLFITIDCLSDAEPMHSGGRIDSYNDSDLRRKLNGEILNRFPEDITEKLVAFENGDFLRLATEAEIFGTERFEPMELRRNLIACRGRDGWPEWWWLQNKVEYSAASFDLVNRNGCADYLSASYAHGVRPVFKILNL